MSIAVLNQVYDEVRRLSIAGSNLASGDFRLKKLVPPLEASAAKAPVFGKVAEAINTLVESDNQTSAAALLELSTLVTAVLYTQGQTGAPGKLEEIETTDFGLSTSHASARVLKPLIESLTTTGSGREEIIKDAHQRGAFQDLRIVRLAVAALDDPYAPIANFVAENVLPMYGQAIYDDLQASYNSKAKGGQVRRLHLMHKLDPERTRELVQEALDAGSPDMKVAAIECLEGKEESLNYLLEQSRAKSSDVRRAALKALAVFDHDEVIVTLTKSLSGNDLPLAVEPASKNRSPKLLKFLLAETKQQRDELLTTKDQDKIKKGTTRLHHLLGAFATRNDKETLELLTEMFQQRDPLGALKGDTDGQDICRRVASLLVNTSHKPALKMIVNAQATLSPELLDRAILAAVLTRQPKEVYDLFSPYYLAKPDPKKRKSDPANAKRETVRAMLMALSQGGHYGYYGYGDEVINLREQVKDAQLDPRWLDATISTGDIDLVHVLARAKHKAAHAFLAQAMQELLQNKGDLDSQAWRVLQTIIRTEHPQAVDLFLAALQKVAGKKQNYYSYWLVRLIPTLPQAAAPQIEALLPDLHDKLVDQVVPYLAELQAKT